MAEAEPLHFMSLMNIWFMKIDGRVLALDTNVALTCTQLHVPNPKSERDAMIAATAIVHQMTIVTRNIQDFEQTGVKLLNPWTC